MDILKQLVDIFGRKKGVEMGKGLICGVSGRARVGKNKLSEFITEEFEKNYNRKFYEASFANELKNMCKFQFGLSDEQLWGDKKEIEDKRFMKATLGGDPEYSVFWTPREIMQEFGAFYRKMDYDFWVKGLRKFLSNELLKGHKDFIITDARYVNEAEFIKSRKGILIHIDRETDNKIHGANHESETSLDEYRDFDINVDNNGSLDDLRKASYDIVKAILSIEKLIKNRRII